MSRWYWTGTGCFFQNGIKALKAKPYYQYDTSLQASWSFATRLAWCNDTNSYDPTTDESGKPYPTDPAYSAYHGNRWRCIMQPGDTVRSLIYWDANNASTGNPLAGQGPTSGGDLRIGALSGGDPKNPVAYTNFMPHPDYNNSAAQSRACVLRGGDGNFIFPAGSAPAKVLIAGGNLDWSQESSLGNHVPLSYASSNIYAKISSNAAFANLPWNGGNANLARVQGVWRAGKRAGDWDTGLGDFPDGPYANKQDEGNVIYRYKDNYTHQFVYPIPKYHPLWRWVFFLEQKTP